MKPLSPHTGWGAAPSPRLWADLTALKQPATYLGAGLGTKTRQETHPPSLLRPLSVPPPCPLSPGPGLLSGSPGARRGWGGLRDTPPPARSPRVRLDHTPRGSSSARRAVQGPKWVGTDWPGPTPPWAPTFRSGEGAPGDCPHAPRGGEEPPPPDGSRGRSPGDSGGGARDARGTYGPEVRRRRPGSSSGSSSNWVPARVTWGRRRGVASGGAGAQARGGAGARGAAAWAMPGLGSRRSLRPPGRPRGNKARTPPRAVSGLRGRRSSRRAFDSRAPGSGCRALARASHGAPRPPPRALRPRLLPPAAAAAAAPPASRPAPGALGSAPGRGRRAAGSGPGSVRGRRGRGAPPAAARGRPQTPPVGRPRSPGRALRPRQAARVRVRAGRVRGARCGGARGRGRGRNEGCRWGQRALLWKEGVVPAGRAGAGVPRGQRCGRRAGSAGPVPGAPLACAPSPPPAPQAAPPGGRVGLEPSAPPRTPSQQSAAAGLAVSGDARLASGREASSGRPSSGRRAPPLPRLPAARGGKGSGSAPRSAGRGRPPPAARPGHRAPRAPPPRAHPGKSAGAAGSPAPGPLGLGTFACTLHVFAYHSLNVCRNAPAAGSPCPSSPPPTRFSSFLTALCGETDAFAWCESGSKSALFSFLLPPNHTHFVSQR